MKTKHFSHLALILIGELVCVNCQAAIVYPKPPERGKHIVLKYLDPPSLKFLGASRVENLTVAQTMVAASLMGKRSCCKPAGPGETVYSVDETTK